MDLSLAAIAAIRVSTMRRVPHVDPPAPDLHDAVASPLDASWRWIISLAYGLLAVAIARFLASGFSSIHDLLSVGGGVLALVVIGAAATAVATVRVATDLQATGDVSEARQHALWVVGIALLLLLPPVQHLTFGRAAASASVAGVAHG